jgi:hypothetical protein
MILSAIFHCYGELSHFTKVFSHFPLLEMLSAIFPLLSNFLPLEIPSAIFHYSRDSSIVAQPFSAA